MARKRMISPEIWDSQDFSKLSNLAKLVFIGLFSQADDEGRGRANATYVKSKLFPYDDKLRVADIEDTLSEIACHMSTTFYTHNGDRYYSFENWCVWQKIDRPAKSKIPPPEDADVFDDDSTNIRRTLDDDSTKARRTLDDDSTNVRQNTADNKNKNKNKNRNKNITRARDAQSSRSQELFDLFWEKYPKKVAKEPARRAWAKLSVTDELFGTITSALDMQKQSPQWRENEGKYIPNPATWINQCRWEDKLDIPTSSGMAMPKTADISEIEERFMEMYSGD